MDDNFQLLSSNEAMEMLAKVANIGRDEAMLALVGGAEGGIPTPEKYCDRPTLYRSDDLVKWVNKYGKKLKKPKLAVEQA